MGNVGEIETIFMRRLTLHSIFLLIMLACVSHPVRAAQDQLLKVQMHSALLSDFWGKATSIDAEILLPDDYYKQSTRHFPTIYVVHAFGGSDRIGFDTMLRWQRAQRALHAEFIIVFLDANLDGGHHVFADSQNYGPWGTALVNEFIPATERHFRTLADANSRFLSGHSSGGWSTLWLQVSHPDVFGGVWSISPDPVDFRDFTGPDLTLSAPGNFYHDAGGHPYMIEREHGHDSKELRWLATREPWGVAQFDSFDEVFSPRGSDGKPKQLFDRHTGVIDETVAKYWELHWDIDHRLLDRWPQDGAQLRGKIHVFVGTDDTFHLDGPVHRMDDELKQLGADAHITFVPGANHWTIFDYQHDLIAEIIREMTQAVPLTNSSH